MGSQGALNRQQVYSIVHLGLACSETRWCKLLNWMGEMRGGTVDDVAEWMAITVEVHDRRDWERHRRRLRRR